MPINVFQRTSPFYGEVSTAEGRLGEDGNVWMGLSTTLAPNDTFHHLLTLAITSEKLSKKSRQTRDFSGVKSYLCTPFILFIR